MLSISDSRCRIAPFRDVLETDPSCQHILLSISASRNHFGPYFVSSNGMNVVPELCQSEPFLPAHIVEYLGFPMSDCTISRCFGNGRHSLRRLPPQNWPLTVACDFVSSNGMNVVPVLCQSEPFLPAHIVEYLGFPMSDCTISRCFGNDRHSLRRLPPQNWPPTVACDFVSSNGMNVVPVLCQSEPFLPAHIVEYLGFPMSDCTISRCFGNDRHSLRRLPPQNWPSTVACDFVSSNGMNVVPVLCQSEPFLPAHIVEYLGFPMSDCTISRCFGNDRHSLRRLPPQNRPLTVACDFVSSNGMNVVPVLCQSEPFLPAHIVEYLGFPMSDCTISRCFGNETDTA